MKNPLFYAKVLLFGEYGVIENAKALTIPLNDYKGVFKNTKELNTTQKESNLHLKKYATYLAKLNQKEDISIRINEFLNDIENGLYFDSNIPQGYGVGSSGALVAAIYNTYCNTPVDSKTITKKQITDLKLLFSKMESYFHGTSSGIDPLICYLNLPLLINSKTNISTVGIPKTNGEGAIFLINSGVKGETEPMVKIFFDKLKNKGFRNTLKKEFIKYNDACIEAFLKGDLTPLFQNLKPLSKWALEHFNPMIPKSFQKIWNQGIESNTYYLKLCGSGGGGYILGFTKDFTQTQKMLKNYDLELVHTF